MCYHLIYKYLVMYVCMHIGSYAKYYIEGEYIPYHLHGSHPLCAYGEEHLYTCTGNIIPTRLVHCKTAVQSGGQLLHLNDQ